MPSTFKCIVSEKRGFSLVELSIVLVILGLLTGGILSGQSLIRASEVRSITSDFQRFGAATAAFRDKYTALPGDMSRATDFWGKADASGVGESCFKLDSSTLSNPRLTCNGNGDGQIWNAVGATSGGAFWGERFRYWQHLANAGLIEGSYTGTSALSASYFATTGKNIPASKITTVGYLPGYVAATTTTDPTMFPMDVSENTIQLVGAGTETATPQTTLKPQEAWNIDTKLDDRRPATGMVYTMKKSSVYAPNCATSDDPATATYDLSGNNAFCTLFYSIE